jgi:DNA-directed RNA polymerase subunit RPC12/RpoP
MNRPQCERCSNRPALDPDGTVVIPDRRPGKLPTKHASWRCRQCNHRVLVEMPSRRPKSSK